MKNIRTYESFINENKPKGAPDWHDSDAPDAEGRFKELGIKDLAAWLIKTRDKDLKKITGSLNQQIVFNRKDDPEYADKMEKVRKEVYKQLGREDLLEESIEVNEKMKIIMRNILLKMVPAAFGASSNVKMREEIKDAIAAAIEPILVKYDYVVEQEEGRDTLAELAEMTMSQLERIEDYAEMIKERMEGGQELDSWMFSQITVALENLNAVHDSLAGDEEIEESWRINKYSPQSYAERVVAGDISFEDAMKESELSFTLLMKLVKKIDKTFKLSFESKYIKDIESINEEKAKGNRGPLDNPDIEVALKKKAEESGIDIALLRIVMRRGMDAWNSGHRPGMGQEQWGYARVNSFIDKEKGTWGGADADVAKEVKK
jgi:hypothetical protein